MLGGIAGTCADSCAICSTQSLYQSVAVSNQKTRSGAEHTGVAVYGPESCVSRMRLCGASSRQWRHLSKTRWQRVLIPGTHNRICEREWEAQTTLIVLVPEPLRSSSSELNSMTSLLLSRKRGGGAPARALGDCESSRTLWGVCVRWKRAGEGKEWEGEGYVMDAADAAGCDRAAGLAAWTS